MPSEKNAERVVAIGGIPIMEIPTRGRNIRIKIDAEGNVYLAIPSSASRSYAEKFALSKYDWIVAHRNEKLAKAESRKLPEGTIRLFGEAVEVVFVQSGKSAVEGGKAYVRTRSSAGEDTAKATDKFLRESLTAYISESLPVFAAKTGLKPASWNLRNMKTRWGTCNSTAKKITFCTRLAEKPRDCIDYVILHELAHLKYPNHGEQFKKFLSAYMPDWKNRRARLNE